MSLDSIITVNITLATVTPSRAAFGVPLVLGFHTRFVEDFRIYAQPSAMLSDGFTVNDSMYKLANAVFKQEPRPPRVMVGRIPDPLKEHTVEIGVTGIVAGQSVDFEVVSPDGTVTVISVPFNTSDTVTATDVATALAAIAGLDASAVGALVTADADVQGVVFFYRKLSTTVERFLDVTLDFSYPFTLDNIRNQTNEFYGVAVDVNSDANIVAVAAWAQTNKKLAGFTAQFVDPADYTATANPLRTGDNDRVYTQAVKNDPESFDAAGLMGVMFAKNAGTATWLFKTIKGAIPVAWTESQKTVMTTDNVNWYEEIAAISMTRPNGKAHGGEFLDVILGLDWFIARLQERILAVKVNADKIPFTDPGIAVIGNEVRGQLQAGEDRALFAPGCLVTLPPVADVPAADQANRLLDNLELTAVLAGAIHKTIVNGTVTA